MVHNQFQLFFSFHTLLASLAEEGGGDWVSSSLRAKEKDAHFLRWNFISFFSHITRWMSSKTNAEFAQREETFHFFFFLLYIYTFLLHHLQQLSDVERSEISTSFTSRRRRSLAEVIITIRWWWRMWSSPTLVHWLALWLTAALVWKFFMTKVFTSSTARAGRATQIREQASNICVRSSMEWMSRACLRF